MKSPCYYSFIFLSGFFLTLFRAHAQEMQSQPIQIEFSEFDLENGLHVIMHKDASMPVVTVNVWYHVGSKNEREGRTGFAHLFEHMMFQGSANIPATGHFKYVQQAGGSLNGSTSYDRTNYFETLPSNQLELGLWLESDRMMSLAVTQRNLDNQRDVVKEEKRQRVDNVPYGRMSEVLFRSAYREQSYKWPVIGSMEDLSAATFDDVKNFHSMFYVPNNASLCIVGDIDFEQTKALVTKYFAAIPKGTEEIYRPATVESEQKEQRRETIYDNVQLPSVNLAFHIPDLNHADYCALDLLATILGSGKSSRLYQRLVYKDRLAQSTGCSAYGLEQPGLFIFRATANVGKDIDVIKNELWEEILRVKEQLVTDNELQKAKNKRESSFVHQATTSQSKAELLNSYYTFQHDTNNINRELERMMMVTKEDIQRVAQQYFAKEGATIVYCVPKAQEGNK